MYHPQLMPDGSTIIYDGDVAKALTKGDPTKGWEGDERLALTWNGKDQRIELWRCEEDGEYRLVLRGKPGKRIVDQGLIDFLVAHDTRRGYNPYAEAMAGNLANEKRIADERDGAIGEVADKLHWALMKDIGHLEGGSRKRLHTVPDWKK